MDTKKFLTLSCMIVALVMSISSSALAIGNTLEAFEDGPIFEADPMDESEMDGPVRLDSCSEINLYSKQTPLVDIPIYEQGETYLCYAYSVAQMVEFSLRKTGEWQKNFGSDSHMNVLWAALAYKTGSGLGIRIKKNTLGSGFFQTAYQDLVERGVCDPSVIEKSMADFKGKSELSDPDFIYVFEALWALRSSGGVSAAGVDNLLASDDLKRMTTRIFPSGGLSRMREEVLKIRDQVMAIPSSVFQNNKRIDFYTDVVFPACAGSSVKAVNLPGTREMGLGFASRAKLKRNIDEVLDSHDPSPITVGYCSGIYHTEDPERMEKASRRRALLPRFFRAFDEKNCSTHYSLIVGRKRSSKTGKCEYLIRNTMGRDFWTRKSSCLCEKSDGSGFEECSYDPVLSPKSDRVVGCYIDELPLLNSIYDLVFFDQK